MKAMTQTKDVLVSEDKSQDPKNIGDVSTQMHLTFREMDHCIWSLRLKIGDWGLRLETRYELISNVLRQ